MLKKQRLAGCFDEISEGQNERISNILVKKKMVYLTRMEAMTVKIAEKEY